MASGMGGLLMAAPPALNMNTIGSTTSLFPVAARSGGATNFRPMIGALTNAGILPRSKDWLAQVDNYSLSLDHLDLREQYNGRITDMNLINRITAAGHNAANAFLYKVVCPIYRTEEFNFATVKNEVYMIPFDRMDPLNVARGTTGKRSMRTHTLASYKRAQEAEMLLLADPNYGQQHLDDMFSAIDKQAELTIMDLIGRALVDIPHHEKLLALSHPIHAMSHTREILMENREVFVGNEDPAKLLYLVSQKVNDVNQIDTLVVPAGFGAKLIKWEGEPQAVSAYKPEYNVAQKELLITQYSNGAKTFKTVPIGNGRKLNVFELQPFVASIDDPEGMQFQPLRGILTMGEVIRNQFEFPSSLLNAGATLSAKRATVYAASQKPTQIEIVPFTLRAMLRNCVLFLGPDGMPMVDKNAGISDYYTKLAADYNDDPTNKNAFYEAFRNPMFLDNNSPPTAYLRSDTSLKDASGYRHFEGVGLCYNDGAANTGVAGAGDGPIQPVKYVGDTEPKSFPASELFAAAELLAQHEGLDGLANNTELENSMSQILKALKVYFPTSIVTSNLIGPKKAAVLAVPTAGVSAAAAVQFTNPELVKIIDQIATAGAFGTKAAKYTSAAAATGKATPVLLPLRAFTPAALAAPLGSPLAVNANESLADYKTRLSHDVLEKAALDGTLGESGSGWVQMAQHVPDIAVPPFLSIVHTCLSNDRVLSAKDAAGITALAKFLNDKSRSAHVSHVLDRVSRALARPQANIGDYLTNLAEKGWLTPEAEATANAAMSPSSLLAASIGNFLENSMDTTSFGNTATTALTFTDSSGAAVLIPVNKDFNDHNVEERSTWQTYNAYLEENATKPIIARLFYIALLQSRFNLCTFEALANVGLQLFPIDAIRPFIYQAADTMSLLASGPGTWVMGAGHGQIVSGISSAQAVFSLSAMMYLGIIPIEPKRMAIIPHAVATEYLGGRTDSFITHPNDLYVPNALDRRSCIAVARPMTERDQTFPMTLTRDPIITAPNMRTNMYTSKTSVTDIVREFIGPASFDRFLSINEFVAEYYATPLQMATHIHNACTWVPNNLHPDVRTTQVKAGTGPFGVPARNIPDAVDAYAGLGNFPSIVPEFTAY